jgi:hypothetical protein
MLQITQIKAIITRLLIFVQEDYKNNTEEDTFLYKTFYGVKDGNFDFYEQGKKLFLRNDSNPRNLRVLLEFPKDKTKTPAYVVREPSKRTSEFNSIGKLTGQFDHTGKMILRDSRNYEFEVMCVSDNFLESILMSEILYSLLLGSYNILSQSFQSISFSMKEVMINADVIPLPFFLRSIGLNLTSDEHVPTIEEMPLLKKVLFADAGLMSTLESSGNILSY